MPTKEVVAVLVDQPAVAKQIKHPLATEGYEVVEFKNIGDFRKRKTLPDLVLADVMLPSGGAKELLDALHQSAPGIPVILVTDESREESGNLKVTAAPDVVGYVSKPVKKTELLSKIKKAIQVYKSTAGETTETSPETHLMAHVLTELHDPDSGRLDAEKIAKVLDISVSRLSRAVGVTPAALQKNPSSRSIQDALSKIAFCYGTLEKLLGSRNTTITWLHAPHPDFGGRSPLSLIEEGKADAVVGLLNDVLAGQIS